MKKLAIKTESEESWDKLLDELLYIEKAITTLEQNIVALNNLSNTMLVTVSSLIKVLVEKKLVTEEELDLMSVKMIEDFKIKTNRKIEEAKDTTKKSFYDALLNSDFMGNS